ncbi:LysE family translocator [Nocardia cyriacigeorgica]|nr:LysE family translocator [Nocardia cyriacigeorgica]MBF6427592.1 LysE family translocator [Nocardia cyriacigeorgica]
MVIRRREPLQGHALASSNHLLHGTTSPAPAPLTPVSVQLDPTCRVYVQVVAVAVGLGAIVTTSATVFTAIKLAGAGYLIWLGIQAIRHRHDMVATVSAAMPSQRRTMMTALRDGFVVGFANPKSIVFLAALLPQFVTTSAGAVPVQMMLLGLCIPVFGLIFDSIWALAAVAARTWFGRSLQRLAAVGATGGVVMIGIGTSLAFTGNRAAA